MFNNASSCKRALHFQRHICVIECIPHKRVMRLDDSAISGKGGWEALSLMFWAWQYRAWGGIGLVLRCVVRDFMYSLVLMWAQLTREYVVGESVIATNETCADCFILLKERAKRERRKFYKRTVVSKCNGRRSAKDERIARDKMALSRLLGRCKKGTQSSLVVELWYL